MDRTSKIGLGSVQFGLPYGISNTAGQTSEAEVSKILDVAFEYGITIIDTAASYGTSETIIGKQEGNRFDIVSKFMPSSYGASIKNQFENTLEALKINNLYGYLAHRPLELIAHKDEWETIQELKAIQKINKIGFSLNEPEEYTQLLAAGIIPDIVQVPFNYFDTRFKEVLIQLKEKGCEVHTRSTFLQGLFFMDKAQLPDFFTPFHSELEHIQTSLKSNLSASLLNYVIEQPFIDKVILGIENAKQLEENINGLATASKLKPLATNFSGRLVMPMHWPKK
jgi:aryl-alcohol dehydrogenase-like predicted oxidoreductase